METGEKKRNKQKMKQNKTTAEKSALMCIFREGLLAITLTCKLNDFFFLVRQINNDDDDDDEGWVGRAVGSGYSFI